MIVQQGSKVKFKRNTEFTKRLRDKNIQISEEKGRGELKGDGQEGTQAPKITASQIKKHKRRKEQWKKRQQKQLQKLTADQGKR